MIMEKLKVFTKRVLVLIIASVIVFTVGCQKEEKPDTSNLTVPKAYGYQTGIDFTAEAIKFIENGKTDYTVVIPDGASADVTESAKELVSYARDVSGATLAVYTENATVTAEGKKFISLGNTQVAQTLGIDASSVKNDGFIIKTVGDDVFIVAKIDRGVRYGVYSFLERFFGVRWLTTSVTHVPSQQTIDLHPCDILEEPEFMMRKWHLYAVDYRYNLAFYNHTRTYYGEWYNPGREYHNVTDYANAPGVGYLNKSDIATCECQTHEKGVPLSEAHPEYWTTATNPSSKGYYDICFTNGIADDGTLKEGPSGVRHIIDKIKAVLSGPDGDQYNWFMIGKMDYRGLVCKCDTCLERYAWFGGHPGGSGFGGVTVMFINCIENEINTWLQETQNGRTVNFATFAYHDAEEPPVVLNDDGTYSPINELCIANEHVYMRVAPIDADYAYALNDTRQPQYDYYKKMFDGWAACSKHLLVWDYASNYFDALMYYPNISYYKDNLRFYKDHGVDYVFTEINGSRRDVWFVEMRHYVASKLFWNLEWDVDYLIDEYLKLYYGAAADGAKELVDTYELFYSQMLAEGTLSIKVSVSQHSYNNVDTYPLEFVEKLFSIIDKTVEDVSNDQTLTDSQRETAVKRIRRTKISPMAIVRKNYANFYAIETQAEFNREFAELCAECNITLS